jgi:hypothetical protein
MFSQTSRSKQPVLIRTTSKGVEEGAIRIDESGTPLPQENSMRTGRLLLVACFVLLASWVVVAQDSATDSKSKADTRTITGCLSKGDSADEFLLTGKDGSTWEIRSSTVSLADHVGHTVSATGVVSNATMHNLKEDTKDVAKDAHIKKDNAEHGHMKITDVQMVSGSCTK